MGGGGELREGGGAERRAKGKLRRTAREPQCVLQPDRETGEGSRTRAQGDRPRSQVRSSWFQKGRAEERGGDLDAVAESLDQAIVLNPRASSSYYVLAGVFRRLGLTDESRKALEMFKRLEQEAAELDKKRRVRARRAAKDPK